MIQSNVLQTALIINGRKVNALVDTGASVSLINEIMVKPEEMRRGKTITVKSYDGSSRTLHTWTRANVHLAGEDFTIEALVMRDVEFSFILSRPDMKKLRMNISWKDEVTLDSMVSSIQTPTQMRTVKCARDVWTVFPELVCLDTYPPAAFVPEVPFDLRDTTIVRKRAYRISHEKKTWLKQELQQMLNAGIIRPSTSPFASPITIVPKEDGSLRLCTDYRQINAQTELYPYPMPFVDDIINDTGGCKWFSRIDLCKGYWQVPLQEESKKYTAFITPFDVYEYNRLPFGWKNSGAWFQRMMNTVLKEFIGDFCNVYVDDVIIYSRTEEEHCSHLSQVLEALSNSHLKINKKKSEFFQRKVVFLGRVLDGFTKTTKEQSVQRIKEMQKPCDVHSLRVFLGLAGHFRAFIKDFAGISRCLTRLTKKGSFFRMER